MTVWLQTPAQNRNENAICLVMLRFAHSWRSATIGSTRIARRAGA